MEAERAARESTRRRNDDRHSSLLDYPATYLLIGINLLVFAIMFRYSPALPLMRQHISWQILTASFDVNTLLRFGGSDAAYVMNGQWWRLITSTFVHVTILHLVLNMWCLWNLGLFGEPLLGRPGLIAVYLLTGTAGMMLSLTLSVAQQQDSLVAGASGAIFGLAGILIVLLSNRKLAAPWKELRSLRRSVIWFAVLNLVIGLLPQALPAFSDGQLARLHLSPDSLPHIDNSAHLGGFLSGLALGFPLFPRMTSGKSSYRARQAWVFAVAAFLLCLFGYGLAKFA
ncbi:Peptidase S54, rhomboid domain protein [Granulicella mallensis MP5ACTX8]|uniref:Peptidase S54, rhomboid domain protein n=1 Tax=Granulicella mallensis (strain ATCC BAA-1857 / DSM 23137 / MP5ACTX8) TaxID=682795 RepID=G8NTS1_GRAMM|nr:Peptidase S54, rhomboid domain protein [Granulicella mallensis MP5ACTX8]